MVNVRHTYGKQQVSWHKSCHAYKVRLRVSDSSRSRAGVFVVGTTASGTRVARAPSRQRQSALYQVNVAGDSPLPGTFFEEPPTVSLYSADTPYFDAGGWRDARCRLRWASGKGEWGMVPPNVPTVPIQPLMLNLGQLYDHCHFFCISNLFFWIIWYVHQNHRISHRYKNWNYGKFKCSSEVLENLDKSFNLQVTNFLIWHHRTGNSSSPPCFYIQ